MLGVLVVVAFVFYFVVLTGSLFLLAQWSGHTQITLRGACLTVLVAASIVTLSGPIVGLPFMLIGTPEWVMLPVWLIVSAAIFATTIKIRHETTGPAATGLCVGSVVATCAIGFVCGKAMLLIVGSGT